MTNSKFKPKHPRKFNEDLKMLGIKVPISLFEDFKEIAYKIRDKMAKGYKLQYKFIKD